MGVNVVEAEEWRDVVIDGEVIPGYRISSMGRVIGTRGKVLRGNESKKIGIKHNFLAGGEVKTCLAHTLVAYAFLGLSGKSRRLLRFRDGDKCNPRGSNLFLICTEDEKLCPKCCRFLPYKDFYAQKTTGTSSHCESCRTTARKQYQQEHRTRLRAIRCEKIYKISGEDLAAIQTLQKQKCAICGASDLALMKNGKKKALAVDHCHETGEVRGLLCYACNVALGYFHDDITLLDKAINYLLAPPARRVLSQKVDKR